MEISLSLDERIDELNHYKARFEDVQKREEDASNEILDLEAKLISKDAEYKEVLVHVDEYAHKLENSQRESNEYSCLLYTSPSPRDRG